MNTAVVDMDKVTQSNAANAEESASASEEMNAQTQNMKQMVGELVALVGGSTKDKKAEGKSTDIHGTKTVIHQTHHALAAPVKAKGKEVAVHKAKEVNPDGVIPMASGPEGPTPRREPYSTG